MYSCLINYLKVFEILFHNVEKLYYIILETHHSKLNIKKNYYSFNEMNDQNFKVGGIL